MEVPPKAFAKNKLPLMTPTAPCNYGDSPEDIFKKHPEITAAATRDIGGDIGDAISNEFFQDCFRLEDGRQLLVVYGKGFHVANFPPSTFVYDVTRKHFAYLARDPYEGDDRELKYWLYGKPDPLILAVLLAAMSCAEPDPTTRLSTSLTVASSSAAPASSSVGPAPALAPTPKGKPLDKAEPDASAAAKTKAEGEESAAAKTKAKPKSKKEKHP